jgi:hypothetical protein
MTTRRTLLATLPALLAAPPRRPGPTARSGLSCLIRPAAFAAVMRQQRSV